METQSGKTPVALGINRVEPGQREGLLVAMKPGLPDSRPLYMLSEDSLLRRPMVREIAGALGAERISGDAAPLKGQVNNFKIAAMELPNFLDHLEDGSLVITPGDVRKAGA